LTLGRQAELRLAVIPQEEPGSSRTVNPARRDRPLQPQQPRSTWWAAIHHDVQRQVVVTWIRRQGVRPLDPAGVNGERHGIARPWCSGVGDLTALDSATPPVGSGAPRGC
jgi:hypothetical protein